MKKIAQNKGNLESTKDIRYITLVGILCFLGFVIEFLGYLSTTILLAAKVIDHKERESAKSVYSSVTATILFTAYTILIQIFWQYVININEAITKQETEKPEFRIEKDQNNEIRIVKQKGFAKKQTATFPKVQTRESSMTETLDGDALSSRDPTSLHNGMLTF